MFYTCNDHAITDVLGKQSSRPAFIFLCSSIFSGNSRIPSYNQWEQDIVFIYCYLNLRTSRRRIYIYICLPYSKPKVSLFAGEGGWLIASGNHGLVFLRMIEQQICVREGKRKGRGKENWRERERRKWGYLWSGTICLNKWVSQRYRYRVSLISPLAWTQLCANQLQMWTLFV